MSKKSKGGSNREKQRLKHDRDLLAANNIKRFGLLKQNKKNIGWEAPELTPLESVSLETSVN